MGKAATATKEAPKGKDAAKEKAPKPAPQAVVTIKASALSTDVGPLVLANLAQTFKDESKAHDLLQGVESKRFEQLALLTQAIVKAARADDTIDLSIAFAGDTKKQNHLNNQIGLALGFREKVIVPPAKEGTPALEKIDYAKAVHKFFPGPKDDKKSPEYQRKATLRTNFLHMVKKCQQAAAAIINDDVEVKMDKNAGTLVLSGPAVEKKFGTESVLLNDKQTVKTGDTEVKLKEKPSFTAIAKMGAEQAGKVLTTRKDSRIGTNAVDPATAVQNIAQSLAAACEKLVGKELDEATKRALSVAQSAMDKLLRPSK